LIKVQTYQLLINKGHYTKRWKHGKVDKTNVAPKIQSKKWRNFLYKHMKIDLKFVKVEIWKNMALHLVYNKLNTNFAKLWYHKLGEK